MSTTEPPDDDTVPPGLVLARRLGVPTRVVVRAMHECKLPRVRLEDGTLGIPADALDAFEVQAS